MDRSLGIFITLIGGIFWGFSGVAGKYLFSYTGVTSDWLVPWRLLSSGTLLLGYLYYKQGREIFRILKEDFSSLFIYAVFGMMGCQYTYFTAVQHSNAAIATVLQYSAPPLILLYICIKEKRKPENLELLSLALASFGVLILSTHLQVQSFVISPKALFWGLVSAVMMAVNTVQPVALLKKYGAFLPLGWGMLLGGIVLFPYAKPYQLELNYSWQLWAGFLAVVFLGTIVAFSLYMQGIKMIGPAKASLIACVEPISATVLSILLLGTSFVWQDVLGIACIILAVLLLTLAPKKDLSQKERKN